MSGGWPEKPLLFSSCFSGDSWKTGLGSPSWVASSDPCLQVPRGPAASTHWAQCGNQSCQFCHHLPPWSGNVIPGWTETSLSPQAKQPNRPLLSDRRWEDTGKQSHECPDTAPWGCKDPEQQSVAPTVEMPREGPLSLPIAQPQEAAATVASHLAVDCRPPGQGGGLALLLAGQPPSLLSQCGCL